MKMGGGWMCPLPGLALGLREAPASEVEAWYCMTWELGSQESPWALGSGARRPDGRAVPWFPGRVLES